MGVAVWARRRRGVDGGGRHQSLAQRGRMRADIPRQCLARRQAVRQQQPEPLRWTVELGEQALFGRGAEAAHRPHRAALTSAAQFVDRFYAQRCVQAARLSHRHRRREGDDGRRVGFTQTREQRRVPGGDELRDETSHGWANAGERLQAFLIQKPVEPVAQVPDDPRSAMTGARPESRRPVKRQQVAELVQARRDPQPPRVSRCQHDRPGASVQDHQDAAGPAVVAHGTAPLRAS